MNVNRAITKASPAGGILYDLRSRIESEDTAIYGINLACDCMNQEFQKFRTLTKLAAVEQDHELETLESDSVDEVIVLTGNSDRN